MSAPQRSPTKPSVRKQSVKTVKGQAKQKKEVPTEDKLKKLFNSLCSQIDGGHFANGIKTCNKILVISPNDTDAIRTKIWLLLQTENYDEALRLISPGESNQGLDLPFEQAYTFYRVNRLTEAREVLSSTQATGIDEKGIKHLEAQLDYRDGRYNVAIEVYERLLDGLEDPEEVADIQTNIKAAASHLEFINSGYLRALDSLPTSITTSLETAPPPTFVAPGSVTPAEPEAAQSAPVEVSKKLRRRRLPKNLPANAPPPDPERWLKKSERSNFSQKRRKGQGGATQGASVSDQIPAGGASGGLGGGGKKGKKKK